MVRVRSFIGIEVVVPIRFQNVVGPGADMVPDAFADGSGRQWQGLRAETLETEQAINRTCMKCGEELACGACPIMSCWSEPRSGSGRRRSSA